MLNWHHRATRFAWYKKWHNQRYSSRVHALTAILFSGFLVFSGFYYILSHSAVKGDITGAVPTAALDNKRIDETKLVRSYYKNIQEVGGGKYRAEVHSSPVQYLDEKSNQWKDISTTLKTVTNGKEISAASVSSQRAMKLYADDNLIKSNFSTKSGTPLDLSFEKYTISTAYLDTNDVIGEVVGDNSVLYENYYDGVDLERIIQSGEIKQNIIIKEHGRNRVFRESLKTPLRVELQTDNSILYYDGDKVVAQTPPIYIMDMEGSRAEVSLTYRDSILEITLPDKGLRRLAYPLVVDPTITVINTTNDDGYVYKSIDGYGAASYVAYYSASYMYMFSSGINSDCSTANTYCQRSFLRFPLAGLGPVTAATLKTYGYSSTTNGTLYHVAPFTFGIDTADAIWAKATDSGQTFASVANTLSNHTVTTSVATDYNASQPYTYFSIYADATDPTYTYSVDNTGTTYDPKLEVTYLAIPPTPTGFTGTAQSTSAIRWSWNDTTEEDGYEVRDGTNRGASNLLCSAAANATYCDQTGLSANTAVTAYLHAFNSQGSNPTTAVTRSTLTNVPTSPTATASSATQIDVGWSAPVSGGVNHYHVKSSSDNYATTKYNGSGTSWSETSLTPNTQYTYRIYGVNADNIESATPATVSKYTLTNVPTSPTATASSTTAIDPISWTAPAGGVNHYHVYSSQDSYTTPIYNSTGTSTNQSGLAANTQYTYRIYGVNADAIESATYATVSRYTLTNIPTSPTAAASSATQIDVGWSAPASGGVDHYHVKSSSDGYVATKYNGSGTSWSETSLTPNTQYTYRIYGVNADNIESATPVTVSKYTLTNAAVLVALPSPTKDNTPQVSATTADASIANKTVRLYEGTNLMATTTALANGTFTFSNSDWGSNYLEDAIYANIVTKVLNSDGVEGAASVALNHPAGLAVDTAAPTTNIASVPAAPNGQNGYYVTNPIITLSVSDPNPSGGNGTTYYKWDDPTFTAPTTYGSPINMNTSIGQGTHTLYYRTIDTATNAEVLKSLEYKLDTVLPTGTGMTIEDNSGYTKLRYVDLHLTGTDATSGMATINLSFDNLTFCSVAFAATIFDWDLEETILCGTNLSGERSRTVYYYFKDNAGNQTTGASRVITQDGTAPTNPTLTVGRSTSGTVDPDLTSSDWNKFTNPKFTWSGASDANAGISGYWVYLGTDQNADPKVETDSDNLAYVDNSNNNFYIGTEYTVSSTLLPGSTYYLKIRVQDRALNDSAENYTENSNLFVYKFDNVNPTSISSLNVSPTGWSDIDDFDFSWSGSSDPHSGLKQYTYIRRTTEGEEEWEAWDYGTRFINPGITTLTGITALYSGVNTLKLKAIDNAGNESTEIYVNYLYAEPVSGPDNVAVDYSQSQGQTVNMLRFYWTAYPDALGYYYSINAAPTAANSTFTATTETGFKQFAGVINASNNIFYVVTQDQAGDTGWGDPSQVSFSLNTIAPGIPSALSITDSSSRESARWQLTISWDEPTELTPDFDGYVIERGTDGVLFEELDVITKRRDNTIPNGYLDTNLASDTTYYYRVRSKDNTGNTSGPSAVVSRMPTGKFTTPPAFTSDPVANPKATAVTINWTTNRPSNPIVQYGLTTSYGQEVSKSTESVTDHEIEILGLTPGSIYHFRAQSLDADRDYDPNTAFSEDYTFRTSQAPGISNVNTTEVRLTSAIITWQTTSSASSKILYGKTTSYGETYTDNSGSQTTTHTVKLTGLSDSTTYHYRIQGTDIEGNVLVSDDYVFETLTFPRLSDLDLRQIPTATTSTVELTFRSNVPTTSQVTFSGPGRKDSANYDLLTEHRILVAGLLDNTQYEITVRGRDQYGNEASSLSRSYKTDFDTRPPAVTDITTETEVTGLGLDAKGQVIVSWETDEPSTSQVEFGIGSSGSYTNKTQEDSALSTTHVVIISDLKPSSPYHFRVVSKDSSDNEVKSEEFTALTPQASRSIFEAILGALDRAIGWMFRR
jgi:hypothetical protein